MVCDKDCCKMSKLFGNLLDVFQFIENYGVDGVCFVMFFSVVVGNDIVFDVFFDLEIREVLNESKFCEQGCNFCNKMWNVFCFMKGWEVKVGEGDVINCLAVQWMEQWLNEIIEKLGQQYEQYCFLDVFMMLYKFIWDDFCSWYLEMIKFDYGVLIDVEIFEVFFSIYEWLMILLYLFMFFIIEEIWYNLWEWVDGDDCVMSKYLMVDVYDQVLIDCIEQAKNIVVSVWEICNSKGVKMKDEFVFFVQDEVNSCVLFEFIGLCEMIIKMVNLFGLDFSSDEVFNSVFFLFGKIQFFLELNQEIDMEVECKKFKEDLEY